MKRLIISALILSIAYSSMSAQDRNRYIEASDLSSRFLLHSYYFAFYKYYIPLLPLLSYIYRESHLP